MRASAWKRPLRAQSPGLLFLQERSAQWGLLSAFNLVPSPWGKTIRIDPILRMERSEPGGVGSGVGSPGPRRSPSSIPTQCISFKCVFHVSKCIDSHKESLLDAHTLSLVLGEGSNHKSHQDPCPRGAHILKRGKTNSLAKKFINKLISHRGRC